MKKCNPGNPKARDPGYECNHATGRWIKKKAAAVKKAVAAPPIAGVPAHLTVARLREMVRGLGHRGYSKMTKAQLVALLNGPPPVAAKKAAKKIEVPWRRELRELVESKGIDFVETTRAGILRKFDPTGWIGSVSQQVLDRFTDRPYTMYDFLDQISEHKPALSEAALKKIRARPDAAHLLHVLEHATAKYRGRNDPFTLYHGTDTQSARAIIGTGIELARGGGRHGTGFYVTPQPSYALIYATTTGRARAGVKGPASPCVLQLRLEAAEAKKLVFGDDFTFDMTSPMDPTASGVHRMAGYSERLRKIIKKLPREALIRFIAEHVAPEEFIAYKRADEKKRTEIVKEADRNIDEAYVNEILNRKINSEWVVSKRSVEDLPPTIRDELRYSAFENRGGIKIVAKSEAAARALQVVRCFVMPA